LEWIHTRQKYVNNLIKIEKITRNIRLGGLPCIAPGIGSFDYQFFFFLPSGRAGHFVLSFVLIQKERTKEKIKATEKLTVCLFIRLKQTNSGLCPSNSVCFSTPHSLSLKTVNFSEAKDLFLRKN